MKFQSLMRELGTAAPAFSLEEPAGKRYSLESFADSPALFVAFICNHCPFVLHMLDGLVRFAADYAPRGMATVAISSNDIAAHPEDAPLHMAELARSRGFGFPYLYDGKQEVAKAFGAVCTPDLFLFDRERKLYYRGRFDESRPRTQHTPATAAPVTGNDLRVAADALLAGKVPPKEQLPSMGCSMKWIPGSEPAWG